MNCIHCAEPIEGEPREDEPGNPLPLCAAIHPECLIRTVIGSVDHQRRGPHPKGTCLGDPPEMTRRQAAKAAHEFFRDSLRGCR